MNTFEFDIHLLQNKMIWAPFFSLERASFAVVEVLVKKTVVTLISENLIKNNVKW